jgi:alkylation response protein AidB-like acyl-CoA dehydrogenase
MAAGVALGLDDEQRQLQGSAQSILAAECPPSLPRQAYRDPSAWRALWKTLVELGWTAVGDSGNPLDLVVLMERVGAAIVPAPFLSSVGLAEGALRAIGDAGAAYREEIANGSVAALLAESPGLRLVDGRLTGRADQVRDADRAELYVAVALDDDGVEHIAVFRPGPGVTVTAAESIDPAQPLASVTVDVKPELAVVAARSAALTIPLVAAAAELVGVAERALWMSVDYAKAREQFGQPIGAFQAVKHRLADVFVGLERARSLTYFAAAVATPNRIGDAETWRAALLAKAAAGDAATGAARAAVAVHGAIAQTWEHDAHLLLRRAWQGEALLGNSATSYAAAGASYAGQGSAGPADFADRLPIQDEYAAWLADFLPADYADRYAEYRWDLDLRRAYQAAAYDAGWLQPSWSPEHGGRSLGPAEAMAVRLESAIRSAPKLPNIAGPNVAAAAVRGFGTDEQIEQLLVPALRGEEWWALGMSEPGAGSDFASLRTKAERRGDVYVVNGQKIWTTQAHLSAWATLYVRTDPAAPKHHGLTCLILDMTAPGVTVRPIQMATVSDETFCEVFLDDVEVPVAMRLGEEGQGWTIALQSLEHERDMIWIMNWVEIVRGLAAVTQDADRLDAGSHGELGRRLADAEALRATGYRGLAGSMAGNRGPETAILKLLGSEALQQTWELAAAVAGPASTVDPDLTFERHDALAATIYGGTSDIQRNIIGERVLGLPRS